MLNERVRRHAVCAKRENQFRVSHLATNFTGEHLWFGLRRAAVYFGRRVLEQLLRQDVRALLHVMVQVRVRKLLKRNARRTPVRSGPLFALLRGEQALLARVERRVEEIGRHGVQVHQTRVRRTRTFPAVQVTDGGSHGVERRLVDHARPEEFVLSDGRSRILLLVLVVQADAQQLVRVVRKSIRVV